jgi:hypothetical protein
VEEKYQTAQKKSTFSPFCQKSGFPVVLCEMGLQPLKKLKKTCQVLDADQTAVKNV